MVKIVARGDPIEPVYLNNLRVAAQAWGYTSGLGVSEKAAGANMSVDVAAGGAHINGTVVTKASLTNVAITAAHATYDRYDLVVINSSGTISVIAGTAAAVSYANDYDLETNNAILLAEVYVPATDTTITDAQITDKRILSLVDNAHPAGLISMWHGLIANIPLGWVLCDGTNSTPDLRGRFVRGAPAATEAGGTGGADTHTLTTAEMPAHTHTASNQNTLYGVENSANHSATNHVTNGNTGSTGGGNAHNNMPAYYAILFIMKT